MYVFPNSVTKGFVCRHKKITDWQILSGRDLKDSGSVYCCIVCFFYL